MKRRRGAEHYRAAGIALIQARELCGHGKWLPWLKSNVKFSQQQASRYMQLAKLPVTSNLESSGARERIHIADNWSELPATVAGNGVCAVLEFLGHALSCVHGVVQTPDGPRLAFQRLNAVAGPLCNLWAWWEGEEPTPLAVIS